MQKDSETSGETPGGGPTGGNEKSASEKDPPARAVPGKGRVESFAWGKRWAISVPSEIMFVVISSEAPEKKKGQRGPGTGGGKGNCRAESDGAPIRIIYKRPSGQNDATDRAEGKYEKQRRRSGLAF